MVLQDPAEDQNHNSLGEQKGKVAGAAEKTHRIGMLLLMFESFVFGAPEHNMHVRNSLCLEVFS